MNLIEKKKLKLFQIERARIILKTELETGTIIEDDILTLLSVGADYGLVVKKHSDKQIALRNIFNAPFLLCDIDSLSLELKKLLPMFLNCRYNMEIDEIKNSFKNGFISEKEYLEEEKLIKFCYYESSKDGKSILKTGHVNNVLDNIIRTK